ncbi:GATA transcription factor [Heracleum sosnowskyi]|uniref:GATA transcription factor n=1 Tax=Heracleum sosnowskyi TaxID=360622 RepID=A0AAD8HIR7_9APIA|nr:GATA transcription factor [Heracleum sosnowskyi]
MNPAYNFNSSVSSFHCLDLNDDHIPEYEPYGITTHPVLSQHTPASSSTCPAFFNLARDYRSESHLADYPQTSQKVDKKIVLVEGSSARHALSASYQQTGEDSIKGHMKMVNHENRSTGTEDDGSMKWMSSKMRVMKRMLHSNSSSGTHLYKPAKSNNANHNDQINSANNCNSSTAVVVRVCSDCKTTKTPLWRGGPHGPKSLCNACGIRRRKARKAIALAAGAAQNDTDRVNKMEYYSSRGPSKIHKEKKWRTSYHDVRQSSQTSIKSTLSFEDFAMSLINKKSTESFPRDEEEAAILLMALSCGLIHS